MRSETDHLAAGGAVGSVILATARPVSSRGLATVGVHDKIKSLLPRVTHVGTRWGSDFRLLPFESFLGSFSLHSPFLDGSRTCYRIGFSSRAAARGVAFAGSVCMPP